MKNKTCGECKKYVRPIAFCPTTKMKKLPPYQPSCDEFEPRHLTVFDHITASPEVLAKEFVITIDDPHYLFESIFTGWRYRSYEEAIAETVEGLKKEWKKDDNGRN